MSCQLHIENLGKSNSGLCNTGDYNTGDYNTGNRNTGDCNTGNRNTGDYNTGNWNTGRWNTGDFCTGDFNISDRETGCFCTEENTIRIFDIDSGMTFREWRESKAYYLLTRVDFRPNEFVWENKMTDVEKAAYPEYETVGGCFKVCDTNKVFITWWKSLNDNEKEIIKSIPNFNAVKFELITGIKV